MTVPDDPKPRKPKAEPKKPVPKKGNPIIVETRARPSDDVEIRSDKGKGSK
jgi:hypothetical protein